MLSTLRHDINNHLSLIIAANELIRHKPEMMQRMAVTLNDQPPKINEAINKFSATFEQAFGITRPQPYFRPDHPVSSAQNPGR